MLSREKQVARDIADLGLTMEDVEDIDRHLAIRRNKEAQETLLEICGLNKAQFMMMSVPV